MLQPDARSATRAARSVSVRDSYIIMLLIILLSSALPPSDAPGRAGRIFARNSPVPGIPPLCDLIPLLFPCYSAVNSAVNSAVIPLLIPLLLRCQRIEFIRQIPESAHVLETKFPRKTVESDFFPLTGESGLSSRPESIHGEPPRSR